MMIFAFDPLDFENRMNVGSTMFLAAMAFLYVVSADLPRVGYLTKMDYCIMFEMFAQIVVVVISTVLHLFQFDEDKSFKINAIAASACVGLFVLSEAFILGSGMIQSRFKRNQVSREKSLPEKTYLSADLF